ncbi:putative integral membrane protein [Babesia bovis T2Bo]|uniref:Uncharacterized protein n=1 Tax=Babesia bovis TaxID=5865 RepID=A7AWY5_BABBO|nr:putative integral membrane protein [Babesia bovis T2Bo]EDO05563.1 putative integral membrane protein [Babesia bovis T2Bo]BAN64429.1 hypothetical protein [Babesia bovis]|eukprot:XP_001609131.1 hypothetical protein [Babesia bovis T2Bo]
MASYGLPGSPIVPLAPNTNLFPSDGASKYGIITTCPGGVCSNAYYDKILRYTPQESSIGLKSYLRFVPIVIIVLVVLILLAWLAGYMREHYLEYEGALEKRLIDAMDEEEEQVHA